MGLGMSAFGGKADVNHDLAEGGGPGGDSRSGRLFFWAARFWLLRLFTLGFLSLRPFLCVRLGRRFRLREATAHTTQHSHEHLITPLLTSTPTSAASMMRRVIVRIAFISSYIEPILCSQIAVHLSFFHHGEMMEDMTYDACKILV